MGTVFGVKVLHGFYESLLSKKINSKHGYNNVYIKMCRIHKLSYHRRNVLEESRKCNASFFSSISLGFAPLNNWFSHGLYSGIKTIGYCFLPLKQLHRHSLVV